nr:hypothetical protein CFP56_77504 [Quercus suber]
MDHLVSQELQVALLHSGHSARRQRGCPPTRSENFSPEMGYITLRTDTKWNTPVVTLPGADQWKKVDAHIINNGFCADLCGQQMFFLDTANYWVSLASKTAALRVAQLVGNEKASVNFVSSYEPYYGKISKASSANSADFLPVSVCIGTERLSVELDESTGELRFDSVAPFKIRRARGVPDFVYGLCYQPADHVHLPKAYEFPGNGTILNFLQPLFPDARSMLTYMWVIGNCARDPIARPRCMLLCGPGGSGKSTALRMATAALSGATNLVADNIITRDYAGLGDKIAQVVIKSRLVTCYELDLDNRMVNMSILKNITGGDYMQVGEFMSKATCSFAIATNGIYDVSKQPEFAGDALSRRIVCIRMSVDTAEAPYEPDPNSSAFKVDFLCACLYVRMRYPDMPISPGDLLISVCGTKYFTAIQYVEDTRGVAVSMAEGREVLAILSGIMDTTPERLVATCRLRSMACVEDTPLGYVLRGLRPIRRRARV